MNPRSPQVLATHRRTFTDPASALVTLTITTPSGATHVGSYRLYSPSAQDVQALGEAEWALDGGALWVACVTNEAGLPAARIRRGDVFSYGGALWEVQADGQPTPDVASVRALAALKERTA